MSLPTVADPPVSKPKAKQQGVFADQLPMMDRHHRWGGVVLRWVLAKALGLSDEAARNRVRRARRRGLLSTAQFGRGRCYSALSQAGANEIGAVAPQSLGPVALLERLSVGEAAATNNWTVLTRNELQVTLGAVADECGPLVVPRHAGFFRADGERISQIVIDATGPTLSAEELYSRLAARKRSLAKSSPAWARFIEARYLGFTVLSSCEREELRALGAARNFGCELTVAPAVSTLREALNA